MRYSELFGKTVKEAPSDAALISHKLLYRGGFIRESAAGRYFFLPLGERVQQKIKKIIKEEMDKAGGQEMLSPVLHPLSLWKETNRDKATGFELMKVTDRRDFEFALGGTAEEMFVDVVRKFQISYKDLPFNVYQFSTKFRDELRARGGLLRVREFIMKDAYSFHTGAEDFKKKYRNMWETYTKIFERMGLKTIPVEADNGYIGGEYSHEFVVESEVGESRFLMTKGSEVGMHEDVAKFKKEEKNLYQEEKPLKEVEAVRGSTMEDGVKLHNLPLWQQIKDVLYVDDRGRFILAVIRGDYDVNEVKLKNLLNLNLFRFATDEEIREKLGSEPGFISPVGIKDNLAKGVELIVVGDGSLRTVKNAYGGANKKNKDLINVNIDRDYRLDKEGDIAMAQPGFISLEGEALFEKRGIEVGNIFQLGEYYSKKMKNATFIDKDGKLKPFYMGCYGIGLGRTMATIAEIHHDEKGLVWPEAVAPFQVHLVGLNSAIEKANEIYKKLNERGIEILFDDREDVSAGVKFADADLIGIPVRLVVSPKTGEKIEWKKRNQEKSEILSLEEVVSKLTI
ncbi:proline--tRNA ligase [Patescibacteria group bacterium]|nr:proline--tRNA ligase [Patescibacteria group bacterium]